MRTATRAMVILCVVCGVANAQAQAADKAEPTRSPAKPAPIIDRGHTALLVMDYQNDIVGMVPEAARGSLVDKAAEALKAARDMHLPIIYVVVRFRDGYPEVSTQNKRFAMLKQSGRLREGTPGAEIHAAVAPEKGDIVVTKRQWGAFYGTDLELQLRRRGITTVVLGGIATNYGVESTARDGYERAYELVLVEDAMSARSAADHAFACERIFPRLGRLCCTVEVLAALGE